MPLAIDTLRIYSRLKSTGLTEESARGIAEIFRETVEENLASKNDLKTTESNLTKDLKTTESNLTKYIESVRTELKKDIAESKAETIKWVACMLVAQAALIATLVKLL